ncbi:hypothetical protein [Shewanella cyperi]|uniref:Uncharacterized protein n=1 Tax=Shewanella cyperi TaxID=2814292 RepID=A0A974XKC4_9GAMM|nr:hypothetical protein [Shewanella cyperi]QSX29991.1 hypothetical protein JYB88_17735 [Shewanella cyperi]QSX40768.1 hypothetical protein JYB84_17795 [Shewanella cyperi]
MKRQIFYAIVAYAAWLTYQDVNGMLDEQQGQAFKPLLEQLIDEQKEEKPELTAYGRLSIENQEQVDADMAKHRRAAE